MTQTPFCGHREAGDLEILKRETDARVTFFDEHALLFPVRAQSFAIETKDDSVHLGGYLAKTIAPDRTNAARPESAANFGEKFGLTKPVERLGHCDAVDTCVGQT